MKRNALFCIKARLIQAIVSVMLFGVLKLFLPVLASSFPLGQNCLKGTRIPELERGRFSKRSLIVGFIGKPDVCNKLSLPQASKYWSSVIHWFFTIQERRQETRFDTLKVTTKELPWTICRCFQLSFLPKRLFPDFVSLQFMCVQAVCSFVSGLISMGCRLWGSSGRASDRESLFQLELLIGYSYPKGKGKKSQKEIKKKTRIFLSG